ncbi:hypothetical protein HC725_16420 [Vibrio sp. S17_S38]|uniref:hypothetical protein n=1 Tax=Vibrio sp. S17_S38 TaxID=2720229 RepID=UPI0016812A1F|nr:hypothetical protein [Vibrio sp. S17_S38]MBD1574834.1 hypothetical protein [Vibrio sp. S17_S38]
MIEKIKHTFVLDRGYKNDFESIIYSISEELNLPMPDKVWKDETTVWSKEISVVIIETEGNELIAYVY